MKNLMILTAALLMVLGCEKQPDYNDIDWQGTWKQGAWVMVIGDDITITDSNNLLTIIDYSRTGDEMYLLAKQTLSGKTYSYEFNCTLINGKDHNLLAHRMDVELIIHLNGEQYGQAEFTFKEIPVK